MKKYIFTESQIKKVVDNIISEQIENPMAKKNKQPKKDEIGKPQPKQADKKGAPKKKK